MYRDAYIPPWPNFDDDLSGKPVVQRAKRLLYETENTTWEQWRPKVASYYGAVSLIDAQIGRVLEFLKKRGLAENTVVIFSTDHGDTFGAHRMRNKDYVMYEEVYHVPLVVRWPTVIEPGRRSDAYTHHVVDLCASIIDIIGEDLPPAIHGRSLLPVFQGRGSENRPQSAFAQAHGCHYGLYTQRSIRTDTHRYIYHPFDTDELYDRINDPYELTNLANDASQKPLLADLRYLLVEWMSRTQDHLYNEWNVSYLTGDAKLAAQAPGRKSTPW
jgi:arylsulfatase A-like enzyme